MNSFLPILITWLQQYGYPALWLAVFISAIGTPLPVSFILLAAGAFAALGDFNIALCP
jgi:membrane-associated protein